ncbi:hypothetical protein CCR75_004950 [Bremia lactucae]|uniref:Uncharacterized protein n=1 Tax=Bremia lactucae TaxID=4779 RepID=A0A976FEI1_BRELC|nr:hypothetical protein CCR75_004950 [Bremia lactucae]
MFSIAGAMLNLMVLSFFVTFDLFKDFWHFLLHEDCRKFFSFVTNDTVYTPTRCFGHKFIDVDQQYRIFREDSRIIYSRPAYAPLAFTGLWIKAERAEEVHFAREIPWCGRLIDEEGVRHDPERLFLRSILYRNQLLLQICRNSCAQLIAPMQSKSKAIFDGHSRRQRYAERLTLIWTPG